MDARVPVGTEILDEDQETVLADMTEVGERFLLAKGGNAEKGADMLTGFLKVLGYV